MLSSESECGCRRTYEMDGLRYREQLNWQAVCVTAVLYGTMFVAGKYICPFNSPCTIVHHGRVHLHYRAPQYNRGHLGSPADTPWSSVIGWFESLTASREKLPYDMLQKSQNSIVNQPLGTFYVPEECASTSSICTIASAELIGHDRRIIQRLMGVKAHLPPAGVAWECTITSVPVGFLFVYWQNLGSP